MLLVPSMSNHKLGADPGQSGLRGSGLNDASHQTGDILWCKRSTKGEVLF